MPSCTTRAPCSQDEWAQGSCTERRAGNLSCARQQGDFPWPHGHRSLQRWLPCSQVDKEEWWGMVWWGWRCISGIWGSIERGSLGSSTRSREGCSCWSAQGWEKVHKQLIGQQYAYSQRRATLAQHEVPLRSAVFPARSIAPLLHLCCYLKDSYCLLLVNLQKCFSVFVSSSLLTRFLPCWIASPSL